MSTALATFKRAHGIATHRLAGAGHRYPWMAFFTTVTMDDGTRLGFAKAAAEFSMADLIRLTQIADADTEEEACQFLAERNRIPWPADEPKRKAKP